MGVQLFLLIPENVGSQLDYKGIFVWGHSEDTILFIS